MHAFRSYIFAARIACDSGPTCNSNEQRVERAVNTLLCVRRNLSQIVLISLLVAYIMRYFAVAMN